MVYCLIKNSSLYNDNIKINYSLINDSENIQVSKAFKINFNEKHITHVNFSQDQFRNNTLSNYIKEIVNDFLKSKYIFGKQKFENYFFEFNEFNEINDKFRSKYIKVDDIIKKMNFLRGIL